MTITAVAQLVSEAKNNANAAQKVNLTGLQISKNLGLE